MHGARGRARGHGSGVPPIIFTYLLRKNNTKSTSVLPHHRLSDKVDHNEHNNNNNALTLSRFEDSSQVFSSHRIGSSSRRRRREERRLNVIRRLRKGEANGFPFFVGIMWKNAQDELAHGWGQPK